MNYSQILAQLKTASAFDLFRLRYRHRPHARRAGLDARRPGAPAARASHRVLRHPGQHRAQRPVCWSSGANRPLLDTGTDQRWLIPYAAINLDGADVDIREKPRQGLAATRSPSATASASSAATTRSAAAASSASMTRPSPRLRGAAMARGVQPAPPGGRCRPGGDGRGRDPRAGKGSGGASTREVIAAAGALDGEMRADRNTDTGG